MENVVVRPYVECVEVTCHVGRVGAREGVLFTDRDLPGVDGFQVVGGVVCEKQPGEMEFLAKNHHIKLSRNTVKIRLC